MDDEMFNFTKTGRLLLRTTQVYESMPLGAAYAVNKHPLSITLREAEEACNGSDKKVMWQARCGAKMLEVVAASAALRQIRVVKERREASVYIFGSWAKDGSMIHLWAHPLHGQLIAGDEIKVTQRSVYLLFEDLMPKPIPNEWSGCGAPFVLEI